MEKLTSRQSAVLEVLDDQIQELEKKLAKYQPFFDELNRLKQTRRVLLSERSTTGGGGNSRTKVTMEEIINVLREADGPMKPEEIAKALAVESTVIRSALNRGRDTRYARSSEGWTLMEDSEDEDDD